MTWYHIDDVRGYWLPVYEDAKSGDAKQSQPLPRATKAQMIFVHRKQHRSDMKNFSLIAFGFYQLFQLKKMKSFVRFFIVHACAGLAALGHAAIAADSSAYGQSVA